MTQPLNADVPQAGGKRSREEAGSENALTSAVEDVDSKPVLIRRSLRQNAQKTCPYMDTINRHLLDFDFEKVCSVSNVHLNVYMCLVCGKYFAGRGQGTPAFQHCLEQQHHVFMKTSNGKVYCLPDNYEVLDASVKDIRAVLHPTYDNQHISRLDNDMVYGRGLDGTDYIPGSVGLNNVRATDYVNVVVQALAKVRPLRDYFLDSAHSSFDSAFATRFGALLRKIWNPDNFKGHVSPHELLQAMSVMSNRRFSFDKQSDPAEFFPWLLNTLHSELTGGNKAASSVVTEVFQGRVQVTSRDLRRGGSPSTKQLPFLHLTLDLPPTPLYRDDQERNIIPQVPLLNLLEKFDGETEKQDIMGIGRKYRIAKLPQYVIMHMKRFVKNTQQALEKNPTIVNFPLKNLDLAPYVTEECLASLGGGSCRYELVAQVIHDGTHEDGTFKAHVLHPANEQWYEIQDLHITEVLPQIVGIAETYIQVYRRQSQ